MDSVGLFDTVGATAWHTGAAEHVPAGGPVTVLCLPQARRNLRAWQEGAGVAGVAVRPHFKGHKTLPLTREQLALGAVGLEVSRLREIEFLIDAGIDTDFVLSWIWYKPATWRRVAELTRYGASLTVDVDSVELADGYAGEAARLGVRVPVRVQLDTGLRGVGPQDAEKLARHVLASPHLELRGLTAYRSLYRRDHGRDWRPFDVLGRVEGEQLASLAVRLADEVEGLAVLCGSTATSAGALRAPGVTEIAGASYVLGDWGLAQLGVMDTLMAAAGVVCTVVESSGGRVTVDAGSVVLGRDDPYPGIEHTVIAAAADGSCLFDRMEHERAYGTLVHGPSPGVGARLLLFPGVGSEMVNVPGEFVVVDERGVPVDRWRRLSSGYFAEDDPVV